MSDLMTLADIAELNHCSQRHARDVLGAPTWMVPSGIPLIALPILDLAAGEP
jgi:hypothetical protein